MALSPLDYHPPQSPLEIIHEDKDICVVDKPSGLLAVPGRAPELFDSVLTRIRKHHPKAQAVHRLDLGTSGVLVLTLRRAAESNLRQQFQERHTKKVYLALVHGVMDADQGQIDLPLICDWPNRPLQKICFETGKPALTMYEVISRQERTTLVRLFPHTGRSHQLRVHLASFGHPIVGDNLYGPDSNPPGRLMLHASQLGLFHPYSENWMILTAFCPFAPDVAAVNMPEMD